MFHRVTLRGGHGSVLWGAVDAAVLGSWQISKQKQQWLLVATLVQSHPFRLRQRGLRFAAPHGKGHHGFWCWPVHTDTLVVTATQLRARLGPPEQ